MFNFFKRKGGKAEVATPEAARRNPIAPDCDARAPQSDSDVTNENSTTRKDVVNLLIPEVDYSQKSGVGAILQMMAGKRKRNKKKRTESCRVSPPREMQINLQRSKSDVAPSDVVDTENTVGDVLTTHADDSEFVKALVLQKYTKPAEKHVSLVYVGDPVLDEKRHAEALLREIARSIDCTIGEINDNKTQMGANDSKVQSRPEPVYETVEEKTKTAIDNYKSDLKGELEKLLQAENEETNSKEESPSQVKKSNLKVPKSDTEGCSDDDRSDNGKKKVTFRKHIIFDDGDQQTDEENGSSFESLTSEEEEEEYLEDSLPDNEELDYVVPSENRTVIKVTDANIVSDKVEDDSLRRISSDNSDSGFIDGEKNESGDDTCVKSMDVESEESESEVTESETEEEIIEEVEEIEEYEEIEESVADKIEPDTRHLDDKKTLVSQESKFGAQVTALTELADARCGEAERARDLIAQFRKEIEAKDQEIEQLKCELASAYKESELIRQRSRYLEEELSAARNCSADLADQLQTKNDECLRQLRAEVEDANARRAELESRAQALERDKDRLQQEKLVQEQKAQEALAAAEANTAKWRAAHEAARSQAAARAERMLADCEWKMRELEKRAREADREKKQLTATVEQLKASPPEPAQLAELQQMKEVVSEQQRSVRALTLQLQRAETREEALKLELLRLKELLDKQAQIAKDKEERYEQTVQRLETRHAEAIESLKAEHTTSALSLRGTLERAHAERTRAALAQLRQEHEQDGRNADRKLREVTTRFENLKEVLASKETQFEHAIAEAHGKADWDIMQLRHLLDKADINYANNVENMNQRFAQETEKLIAEWSQKVKDVEEEAATAAEDAKQLLESTRVKLIAERMDQVHKLKEQHKQEMEEQWEKFMNDKETCLERMKAECRQEGEEDRVKREKELMEEIAELRSQMQSKSVDFDQLAVKASACGRTLAVTEEELREALAREKDLREKRAEDATRIKQVERASKDQIDHLQRKCACLRKLFDDIRARLAQREQASAQETRSRDKELHQLRAEVARLTKILVEQSSPKLGARTRADGCELADEAPRRKGGTLRTPEPYRKRPTNPELTSLLPPSRQTADGDSNGRRRSKSVDLPAVQVPIRIKQLQEKNKDFVLLQTGLLDSTTKRDHCGD